MAKLPWEDDPIDTQALPPETPVDTPATPAATPVIETPVDTMSMGVNPTADVSGAATQQITQENTTPQVMPWENDPVDESALPSTPENKIGSHMYDGMVYDEALQKYVDTVNSPNTSRDLLHRPVYREREAGTGSPEQTGTVIPFPERDYINWEFNNPSLIAKGDNTATVSATQVIPGAVEDAVRNSAITAASLIDKGLGTKTADWIQSHVGSHNPQGADKLVAEAAQLTIGTVVGAGAGKAAGLASEGLVGATNVPKIASALSKFGGFLGGIASIDPNSGTLLVGDSALAPLFDGVQLEQDGTVSQAVLEKKINMLIDNALIVGPIAHGIRSGAEFANKVVKAFITNPLKNLVSADQQEIELARDAVRNLNLDPDDPQSITRLQTYLKDHAQEIVEVADQDIPNATINRTSMSAIHEGAMKSHDEDLANRAMEVEAGALQRETPLLKEKTAQPVVEMQNTQKAITASRGGLPAIEQSRQNFATQGREAVEQANAPVTNIEQQIESAKNDVTTLLKDDPLLGEAAKSGDQNINIFTMQGKTEAEDRAINGLKDTVGGIIKTSDDLFDAIPEDVMLDADSLASDLGPVKAILPEDVQQYFENKDNAADLSTLYRKLIPEMRNRAYLLRSSGTAEGQDASIRLYNAIDNIMEHQRAYVASTGGGDALNAVDTANSYYRDVVKRWEQSDAVGNLFGKYRQAFPTRAAEKPENFLGAAQQTLTKSLSNDGRHYGDALIDFATGPEGKVDPQDVENILMGDLVKTVQSSVGSGKNLLDIQVSDLMKPIEEKAALLIKRYPEATDRVNSFLTKLRNNKGTVQNLEEELTSAKELAKQSEDRVLSNELGRFITKQKSGDIKSVSNGYEIFKKMLSDPHAEEDIRNLIQRADPVTRRGMEAAYSSYLEDILAASPNKFNLKNAEEFLSDKNPLWSYGDEIFEDKNLLEFNKKVVQLAVNEARKRTSKAIVPMNAADFTKEGRGTVDFAITMVFGVLSRMGARLRSTSSKLINKLPVQQRAQLMLEAINKDPEHFSNLLEKIKAGNSQAMTEFGKDLVWKILLKEGVYNTKSRNQFDEDWNATHTAQEDDPVGVDQQSTKGARP